MLYSIMFIASFPFQWCKSHVCGVSGSWLMVHQWLTSHLHIVASLHFVLDNFTRSDSESDVCFCLSASCQKIADRWCHLLSLWAASPMGVGLIGFALHIVATLMSLVIALHTSLTPYNLTTKYRAQAQAPYIFTFLMADPVYVYRADKLCRHLDSIPGPLDPELNPLPVSPRRLHG